VGIRERLSEAVETRTGYTAVPRDRLTYLEESDAERRAIQRELDLLAYTALDYTGGAPQELKSAERRKLAQRARVVWMRDPQAGAAIDLMNEFCFGRGIPKPKANDEAVQEVLDEAWDDPDNQAALTSLDAQLANGVDLSLQANLFFLVFDDGEDGKVKLGILNHDDVERVVRDPDNRLRVLYYVAREEIPPEEDYKNGQVIPLNTQLPKTVYYEHWRNVELAVEEAERGERDLPKLAPKEVMGDGKVFHVAINKTMEMSFGHPPMDRLLRWYTAYNKFMDARVDIMEGSAAFIMKRKVEGTPAQLKKMATQALSRSGAFGSGRDPDVDTGPRAASILEENKEVTHEPFKLSTGGAEAAEDARMLGAQVSAATRFPRSYYGDPGATNLATATSLELPVLKAVEARQEIFERIVRFFVDRVIERAVDAGRISDKLSPEEIVKAKGGDSKDMGEFAPAGPPPLALAGAHEDAVKDEADTERDLGYQFSMPSPLRRMLADLVTAIMNIAKTFDPNGTNIELSRILLTIALGEGLEMEDPAKAVEEIFPPGYQDPMMAQAMQPQPPSPYGEFQPGQPGQPQPGQPGQPGQPPGHPGADGRQHPGESNPYGAPMRAQPPELRMVEMVDAEAVGLPRNRFGESLRLAESHAARRVSPQIRRRADRRQQEVTEALDGLFAEVVGAEKGES
jgi:hypothetical protein